MPAEVEVGHFVCANGACMLMQGSELCSLSEYGSKGMCSCALEVERS